MQSIRNASKKKRPSIGSTCGKEALERNTVRICSPRRRQVVKRCFISWRIKNGLVVLATGETKREALPPTDLATEMSMSALDRNCKFEQASVGDALVS